MSDKYLGPKIGALQIHSECSLAMILKNGEECEDCRKIVDAEVERRFAAANRK